MADTKVSALPALAAAALDPVNDFIMVGDASVGQSKRMAPVEMIRATLPSGFHSTALPRLRIQM